MNFKGLLIFKTVYEMNSLNKAAKILGYTQSNLTAHLKKIEHELRASLFIRRFDGVIPTEEGQQFYHFAIQTLDRFAQLQTSFKFRQPTLLISELLFQFIVIEQQKYEIGTTEIVIKRTSEMNHVINEQFFDNVITFKKFNHADYCLVATKYLPVTFLKSHSNITHQQLPILINNDVDCPLRAKTLAIYQQTSNIITVDSLSQLLNLVEKGQGIALLPLFLQKDNFEKFNDEQYLIAFYCYQHQSI